MHHQYLDPDTIQAISAVQNRAHYSAAVALAIAYALPLPSQPVESPLAYFQEQFKQVAENVAGVFTEVRPLSITETGEDVRQLWNARYAVAHGSAIAQITAGSGMSSSVLSLFGISYSVNASLLKLISDNAAQIEPIYAKILSAIVRTNMVTAVQSQAQ